MMCVVQCMCVCMYVYVICVCMCVCAHGCVSACVSVSVYVYMCDLCGRPHSLEEAADALKFQVPVTCPIQLLKTKFWSSA